jgi:hypothetical protein
MTGKCITFHLPPEKPVREIAVISKTQLRRHNTVHLVTAEKLSPPEHTKVRRTVQKAASFPRHTQQILHLETEQPAVRLNFAPVYCAQFYCCILFTDRAQLVT